MKMPKLTRIAPAALVALGMMAAGNAATAAITSHDDNQANPRGWSAVAGMETSAVIELARTLPLSRDARADPTAATGHDGGAAGHVEQAVECGAVHG